MKLRRGYGMGMAPSPDLGFGRRAGGGGAPALVLDSLTAGAAYSTRKLRTAYSGSALRVRRSSDNTEQDIGFVDNALDTASLTAFVGANSAFVVTWYDQSGNGRNVTNATTSTQPRIVNAGTLEVIGTKPAPFFQTNSILSSSSPFAFANGSATFAWVSDQLSSGDVRTYYEVGAGSARYIVGTGTNDQINVTTINDAGSALNSVLYDDAFNGSPGVFVVRDSGTLLEGFVNGANGTNVSYTRTGAFTFATVRVGGTPAILSNLAELIIFPSVLSNSDMNAVTASQGGEYGIYVSPFLTPVEQLAVTNGTGDGGQSLGVNISDISDSHEPVFIDRAKQARGWESPGVIDSTGALTSISSGSTANFFFSAFRDGNGEYVGTEPDRGGTFRVTITQGAGSLTGSLGCTNITSINSTTWDFDCDWIGNKWLTFTPTSYPLQISIVHHDNLTAHANGDIWDPVWLATVPDAGCLRFMDTMRTNGSTIVNFSEWPTLTDQTWEKWPFEIMVDLCNRKGADPWFTMPHQQTSAFVTSAATIVRDNLDAGLKARFEYSNEVWNTSAAFTQSYWLADQVELDWGVPDGFGDLAWIHYAGKKFVEMMQTVNTVFAGETSRVIGVLGTQAGNTAVGLAICEATTWQTYEPGDYVAPKTMAEEFAIAAYLGFGSGSFSATNQGNAIKTQLDISHAAAVAYIKSIIPTSLTISQDYIDDNAAIAGPRGLRLTVYEYNNHYDLQQCSSSTLYSAGLPVAGALDAFMEATFSQEMADGLDDVRDYFKAQNGALMCVYYYMGRSTRFGTWGSKTHTEHDSAVWNAAVDWHAANGRHWAQ